MELLFFYSLRNVLTRRTTTALTAAGMALVVFVFAAILMLAEGLQKTLVDTGSPDNALVIRRSSETEVQSAVARDQAAVVATLPGIAMAADGKRLIANELVVLIALKKKNGGNVANVVIRGIGAASLALRPQVRVVAGRQPRAGIAEVMVGAGVAQRFAGAALGEALTFAARTWRIVGIFEAGQTAFASEIWGNAEQLMAAFNRPAFSSVLMRLRDPAQLVDVRKRLEGDPRLTLEVQREPEYYRKQSEMMATFLRVLGWSLTLIFSIGAVVGAMITMYSAVAHRIAEIGTLRALGFQRPTILFAFLLESLLLGLIGGVTGLVLAAALQFISVSTVNFQTFSELAFRFTLTPRTAAAALAFALIMGFAGGILPAYRAARVPVVEALRAV